EIISSYNLIIEFSVIIILSFLFNEISKKTNIPTVLMLISLGLLLQYIIQYFTSEAIDFFPILEVLVIVGLIMIVLEAALELELKREKLIPILKALAIALLGFFASAWAVASILYYYIPEMSMESAWLYATPLSILSSSIIIPSVVGLKNKKKEFHIYESTFSDIIGIMLFYFLTGKFNPAEDSSLAGFGGNFLLTVLISLVASYA